MEEKTVTLADIETYIRENLSITINNDSDYYSNGLRVTLRLNGEEISSDSIFLGNH